VRTDTAPRAFVPPPRWLDLDGRTHYVRWDGPELGIPWVLVHGLGGSLLNWMAVGPALAERGPVYALDLAGFGRTPLDDRSATPHANRLLVHRFIHRVVGRPVLLAGNSMGGSIAMLEAAVGDRTVAGLILTDPALPLVRRTPSDPRVVALFAAQFIPGFGEWFARSRYRRLGPERLMDETLRLCTQDPSRIAPEVREAHVALARERAQMGHAVPAFLRATRSVVYATLFPAAPWRAARAVPAPALVVHGAADRLVPLAAAHRLHRLRPDFHLTVIDDVGHIPQLEAPERWLEAVESWLADRDVASEVERRAAAPLRPPRIAG